VLALEAYNDDVQMGLAHTELIALGYGIFRVIREREHAASPCIHRMLVCTSRRTCMTDMATPQSGFKVLHTLHTLTTAPADALVRKNVAARKRKTLRCRRARRPRSRR
jgi:hypothetical protein